MLSVVSASGAVVEATGAVVESVPPEGFEHAQSTPHIINMARSAVMDRAKVRLLPVVSSDLII